MKKTLLALFAVAVLPASADPALTIYNQNFAVVRDDVPLDLKAGVNPVSFADATAQLEPDSVILRDPTGKVNLHILEQSYRNDPVSQGLLLYLNEGKTIDFLVRETNKPDRLVQGKIIRSGYQGQSAAGQPVIDVDGKIQFELPGLPQFPSLGNDTVLKPTLTWQLNADVPGKVNAEIAYITSGMSWHADYNIVVPETGDLVDVVGWITMNNQAGKTFNNAAIKLMAGDVNKIQEDQSNGRVAGGLSLAATAPAPEAVTQKAFADFHLYSLPRATTLRDGETKQVEFIHASGVKAQKLYVYDGAEIDWDQVRYNPLGVRDSQEFGTQCNKKIAIIREFKNSEENHLGMPLPKGRLRFYNQDGQQLEFTGENEIDHTAKDETLKIYLGNAFDIVGERKRTNFRVSKSEHWIDESFEINLRNHEKDSVTVRAVEHLYRGANWEIRNNSMPFTRRRRRKFASRSRSSPTRKRPSLTRSTTRGSSYFSAAASRSGSCANGVIGRP